MLCLKLNADKIYHRGIGKAVNKSTLSRANEKRDWRILWDFGMKLIEQAKMLNEWLSENKGRIEVFFLPPDSPELNPQEYVSQDVMTNIIGKKRPVNKAQMPTNVEDFMNGRKQDRKQVQKYFHVSHVR